MRLTLHVGGYRLAPRAEDGDTWMASVTCLDPGGSVPAAVVAATAKKRALVIEKIRTLPRVAERAQWAPLPPAMAAAAAAAAGAPAEGARAAAAAAAEGAPAAPAAPEAAAAAPAGTAAEGDLAPAVVVDAYVAAVGCLERAARDPAADGWKLSSTTRDGLEVWLKKSPEGLVFSMGRGVVAAPPHAVMAALEVRNDVAHKDLVS